MTDDLRERLLMQKLGAVLDWQRPLLRQTVGPYEPENFDEYDRVRAEVINDCRAMLNSFSDEVLKSMVDRNIEEDKDSAEAWRNLCQERIWKLNNSPVPWYAGGFGHPAYEANRDYWAKMPRLSIHEATCLSVGVEPKHIKSEWIARPGRKKASALYNSTRFLLDRFELIRRTFDPQDYDMKVDPRRLVEWADKLDVEVDPDFINLLRRYHASDARQAGNGKAKPSVDRREYETVAKLFAVLAIDAYGYDPKPSRSPTPREIANIAAGRGVIVHEQTIRKHLRAGAKHVPDAFEHDQE